MAITNLADQLIRDEDEDLHAYPDFEGYLAIGIGYCIDKRVGCRFRSPSREQSSGTTLMR